MAAVYCAKYCGKDAFKFGTNKRYWQSLDYDERPDREPPAEDGYPGSWTRVKVDLDSWCMQRRCEGFHVEMVSAEKAIALRRL